MRHFHVLNTADEDTGSWSAGSNGEDKVLAQLTDTKGSQSRAALDVVDATILVQHLISACQAVLQPDVYPMRDAGKRWQVKRTGKDVQVMIYDEVLPPETTIVTMTIDDATDFAVKLMEAIGEVQRKANEVAKG